MNHILRGLVLRPARKNPLRAALSIAGVAIGVASVGAIHRANRSVTDSFRGAVDAVSGSARLSISGIDGVPEEAGSRLKWVWEIGAFAPVLDRFAVCADGSDEPVEIFGVDVTSEPPLRQYRLIEPRRETDLRRLFDRGAAVAPLLFAKRHRLRVGDSLPLFANGHRKVVTIAGLLDFSGPARAAGGQILVLGLKNAQELMESPGRVDRIDVTFSDSNSIEGVRRRIAGSLGPGLSVERPESRGESADKMVRAFRFNLTALGSITLLVGMFLIYNTLSMSVLRRRPEIGIVRALGGSKRQIFHAFLLEGAVLGLAGTALGEILGVFLSRGALAAVGSTVVNIYKPAAVPALTTSLEPFLTSAAAGILASLFASLAPALEAARVEPATTMRSGSIEGKRRLRLPRLAGLALLFSAACAALCVLPAVNGFPLFGFLAVGCAVACLALLSPAAILVLERGLRRALKRVFRAPGRLAGAFFAGNASRNAVAIAALSLALGMTAAMAVMIASLRRTVTTWVSESVVSDLILKSATGHRRGVIGTIPASALDFLRSIPGVAVIDPYRAIDTADAKGNPFTIGSGDYEAAARLGGLPLLSGGDPAAEARRARVEGSVFVSEPYALKFGVKKGETVTIPTPEGEKTLRIGGVYSDYSNDRGSVVLDRRLFLSLFHDDAVSTVAIEGVPGVSPDELRNRILAAARGKYAFSILTNRTLRREVLRIFDRTFAVTYALEGISLCVAVLGVVNALFALILERRRELALLRVLGASASQLTGSIAIEAGLLGITSLLLAAVGGAAFSAILIYVINRQSFGWTIRLHVPSLELAAAFALAFAATLAAALGPGRIAARIEASGALREE